MVFPMRSKKEWAEFYATTGWQIFPCHFMEGGACSCGKPDCERAAKHPRTRKGFKDASSDAQQVRAWWGGTPGANIGIATGAVSGVWVLDVDGPEGRASLEELERQHGPLPPTVTARTGKGEHRYFLWNSERPVGSRSGVLPGIDTRGDGGYVIAPPSNHRSGVDYAWDQDRSPLEAEFAHAPDWLLDLVCRPKRQGAEQPDVDEVFRDLAPDLDLRTAPGAPEGKRHNEACKLIGSALGRQVSPVRLTALALAWGQRCDPPMDEEEICQIIENLSQKDAEKLDDLSIDTGPEWPTARSEAFYGLAGDIIRAIEPETEADSMALLLQLLVFFGTTIGRKACCLMEATLHYGNLFVVIVGDTALARKGTSFDRIRNLFKGVPSVFPPVRTLSGLSSGEGLIWQVRDPVVKDPASKAKPIPGVSDEATLRGVNDKRLIAVESEFASVLASIKREGNTLSPVIREAWQSGNLETLVKHSPARATNAHISIIGHITLHELRSSWPTVEGFNGFANRFLWAMARRSKLLPDGGRPIDLSDYQRRLNECIEFAACAELLVRNEEASPLWYERYPMFGVRYTGSVGGAVARGAAQVVRLSMLYALLDRSNVIRLEHLQAAFAVWDYCEESAAYIFGDSRGNRTAERILTALRERCRTTRDFHRLFNNRLSASELKSTLETLLAQRLIRFETRSTGGRPSQVWYIV